MNFFFIESQHDIVIDNYNDGEGSSVNWYSNSANIEAENAIQAIEKYFKESLYFEGFAIKDAAIAHIEDFSNEKNLLHYSYLVDSENCQASEYEIEQWRKGEFVLYSNNVSLRIWELQAVELSY